MLYTYPANDILMSVHDQKTNLPGVWEKIKKEMIEGIQKREAEAIKILN